MGITGNMEEQEIKNEIETFNKWFSENYNRLKTLLKRFCWTSTYNWDEDLFHEMYLDCISAIKGGKRLNYSQIDNYLFIAYKNNHNSNKALAWHKSRDQNFDSTNIFSIISGLTEDNDEKMAEEEQFQRLYNFLCRVERDIYNNCGEDIGQTFSKKFDGQMLDIKNGDRKKFEIAKKYVREKYTEYYNNLKKINNEDL